MAGLLVILHDHVHLQCVRRARPGALRAGMIAVCEADLHGRLLAEGVEHLTPWDAIDDSDRPALEHLRREIVRTWDAIGRIDVDGMNLLRAAHYRHLRCWARVAWVLFAVRQLIARCGPDRVVAVEEPFVHALDRPPEDRRFAAFGALVRGACAGAGVPFDPISSVPPERTANRWRKPKDDPIVAPRTAFDATDRVLFLGSGSDLLRQLPVIRRIAHYRPLQVHRATGAAIVGRLQKQGHAVVAEHELVREVADRDDAGVIRAAAERFDAAVQELPDELAPVFRNPAFRPHFDFLFGEYARGLARRLRGWRRLLRERTPALVVSNYAAPPLDAAVAEGVPVLVLPHGIMLIGDRAFCDGLPQGAVLGAVSDRHRAHLLEWGVARWRVRVTGDPGAPAPVHEPAGAPRGGSRRILLPTVHTTCTARLGELPEVDWKREREVFVALRTMVDRHANWRIVIRPHPRYDHEPWFYGAIGAGCSRWEVSKDASLAEAVSGADVVLFVNGRSSAIPEASGLGRPVFLLGACTPWLDRARWGLEAWPYVATIGELEGELTRTFADAIVWSARWEQTRRAAEGLLAGAGDAVAASARVIQEMAAGATILDTVKF